MRRDRDGIENAMGDCAGEVIMGERGDLLAYPIDENGDAAVLMLLAACA